MGNGSPLPVRWKRVMVGLSALLAFSFVLSFSKGERGFVAQRDRLQWALVYLEHPDLAPDEFLKVFYPDPEVVRERAKVLLQRGILKKIEWPRLDRLIGGNIRIDSINDHPYRNPKEEVVVDPDMDKILRLRGWAVDEVNRDCGKRVYVVFAGNGKEITFPAERTRREDVAMQFGAADYYRAGWFVWASSKQFEEACYSLSVRMLDTRGKGFYEMKEGRLICFSRGSSLALRNLANPLETDHLLQETQIYRERPPGANTNVADFYVGLAGRYLEENRLEEAMYSLRTALEIDPTCCGAYYNLGKLYYKQHRLEESLAALRRTVEINPDYFAAHYGLGLIFLNKNMLKESEGEFKKALDLNPSYENTLFNLGVVYGRQGRVSEAEELWIRTLEVNPEHIDARLNLAIAYYNRRDFTRAKIYFMNLRKKGMSIDTRILRELDIP